MQKRYGFWNFILDILLVTITGGLWVIWIFVREMRKDRRPRYYQQKGCNCNH